MCARHTAVNKAEPSALVSRKQLTAQTNEQTVFQERKLKLSGMREVVRDPTAGMWQRRTGPALNRRALPARLFQPQTQRPSFPLLSSPFLPICRSGTIANTLRPTGSGPWAKPTQPTKDKIIGDEIAGPGFQASAALVACELRESYRQACQRDPFHFPLESLQPPPGH